MKRVLWISRHCMTKEQMEDLERITGEEIELMVWKDTVHGIQELKPVIREADLIAAVLPLELMVELLKVSDGKMVLQSVAERIPAGRVKILEGGREEQEFIFRHRYWQQVIRIDVEVRKFL